MVTRSARYAECRVDPSGAGAVIAHVMRDLGSGWPGDNPSFPSTCAPTGWCPHWARNSEGAPPLARAGAGDCGNICSALARAAPPVSLGTHRGQVRRAPLVGATARPLEHGVDERHLRPRLTPLGVVRWSPRHADSQIFRGPQSRTPNPSWAHAAGGTDDHAGRSAPGVLAGGLRTQRCVALCQER
jgi:hypothetical protein